MRWRDVDGLGHVNHAVFLTYLEEGRDAFYVHALGRDPHYVVARVEVDLRAEVRYGDRQLQVRIEVERVGTTSLTTRETILTRAGVTAAEARVVTVLWDAGSRKLRLRESMHCAGIDFERPVDIGSGHVVRELRHLRRRDHRIGAAMAYEHARLDMLRVLRTRAGKPRSRQWR